MAKVTINGDPAEVRILIGQRFTADLIRGILFVYSISKFIKSGAKGGKNEYH